MINKTFHIFTDPIKKVPDAIPEVTDPVQFNSWLWGNHNTTNTFANTSLLDSPLTRTDMSEPLTITHKL